MNISGIANEDPESSDLLSEVKAKSPFRIDYTPQHGILKMCCYFNDALGKNIRINYVIYRGTLVAQTVKNLLAMQETQVWFLGQEDLLEKGMATHSSTLAWRINNKQLTVLILFLG